MKAILFCPGDGNSWVTEFFPGYPVYRLPFANKPAIEFAIDYCFLHGIRAIQMILDEKSSDIRSIYGDGNAFGISFSYSYAELNTPVQEIITQNLDFCLGDDLLILAGFFLPDYDKRKTEKLEIPPGEIRGEKFNHRTFWYLLGKDALNHLPDDWSQFCDKGPVKGFPVNTILDYYRLNMHILQCDAEQYNLPGIQDETHCFLGLEDHVPPTASIQPPSVIGDYVMLGKNTKIGPSVIIGNHCLVDNDTVVSNSVILNNTYIGCKLELDEKICYRNWLIDPKRKIQLSIKDSFLLSPMDYNVAESYSMSHISLALLLFLVQLFPYLFFRLFLRVHVQDAECFIRKDQLEMLPLHCSVEPEDGVANRLFRRLSLPFFPLLPWVLKGRIKLVGNRLLETNGKIWANGISNGYVAGIFTYSEYLGHKDSPLEEKDELCYSKTKKRTWLNLKILLGILARNFRTKSVVMPQKKGTDS